MPGTDTADIEATVLRWWVELLPTAPTTADDDFFDLGGESLQLVRFVQRVDDTYGVQLPVTELFADAFTAHRTAALIATMADQATTTALADQLSRLPAGEAAALLGETGH